MPESVEVPLKFEGVQVGTAMVFRNGVVKANVKAGLSEELTKKIFGDGVISFISVTDDEATLG